MRPRGKNGTLILSVLIVCLYSCRQERPAVMPVSAFTIEIQEGAHLIFSESATTLRITYSDPEFILPATLNQRVLKHTAAALTSTVILRTGLNANLGKGDPAKHLADTPYLDTKNPMVAERAAEFRKSSDPVKGISMFVYNHITRKNTGIPLLPASVILKERAGDCTEHSILTAALLRAAGIPARCVTGVILAENFRGKHNVFVYHMWVEAFYAGKWVFVDSTRPMSLHPNRYIAFTYHPLTTEAPLCYISAISSLTDVTIELAP